MSQGCASLLAGRSYMHRWSATRLDTNSKEFLSMISQFSDWTELHGQTMIGQFCERIVDPNAFDNYLDSHFMLATTWPHLRVSWALFSSLRSLVGDIGDLSWSLILRNRRQMPMSPKLPYSLVLSTSETTLHSRIARYIPLQTARRTCTPKAEGEFLCTSSPSFLLHTKCDSS